MPKFTREQIEQMNPAALRLEIAACLNFKAHDESGLPNVMPDWPADLNAVSELFKDIPAWQSGKSPNGMFWSEIYNPLFNPVNEVPDRLYYSKTEALARCKTWLWRAINK